MMARSAYFLGVIDAKLEMIKIHLSASEIRFITTEDLEDALKEVERIQHLVNRIWDVEHDGGIYQPVDLGWVEVDDGSSEDSTV